MSNSLSDWKKGFVEVDKEKHWREGYSAYSLGRFFTEGRGEKWLDDMSKPLFGEKMVCHEAVIEHESKLDSFKGTHRMQDLAIWGEVRDENVFVAIEAKVLESFGSYLVRDEYERALQYKNNINRNSNKPDRIREIVADFFPGLSPYDEPVCNLRYQLLHYLKGSLEEGISLRESKKRVGMRRNPKIIVLPVLVFKTRHYYEDTAKADLNKNDYEDFCLTLGFTKVQYGGKFFYSKEIKGRKVFTIYEEIDV